MAIAKTGAFFLALLAIASSAALGCSKKKEALTLRDTEGRSFEAICDRAGECSLRASHEPKPSAPAPKKGKPTWAFVREGKLFGACDAWSGEAPEAWDCRALVCDSDADCPAIAGARTGMCMSGLCEDPSKAITAQDSVMLCLAGTGPGYETAAQIERYAMGKECGSPCRVPSPCRQP